ncbi:hypothetical protein BDK92_5759 [Micromonospora pisi]|uniref:Peptidase inhibitor family I36 n=1 Tax=Micromonospora pisi TaxID=589240 RepID=A0A495JRV4_9ACTN|nr:DUF6289 family protein [Micromonospora pisi]RKR91365.1 hypothetical protein BDK92_5759 [Micromonospora pisi]
MIRRVLLAATIAVAAFVIVPGSPAQARACKANHDCYTEFYSDSSHTVLVGSLSESCTGERDMWGRRTGYLVFSESPC